MTNLPTTATPTSGNPQIAMANGGTNVICPGCQAPVSRASKFCGKCGARLWEPCLDCSELNSVGERFCNGCGSDLSERLNAAWAAAQQALEQAAKLAEFGNMIEAVRRLEATKLAEHSQLQDLSKRIATHIDGYRTRRAEVARQADDVLDVAKKHIADARYALALVEAEKIPPALRNAELAELHKQLSTKVKLAARLREQLQAGVTEKKYEGLVYAATQLVEIDPHDEGAKKLLAQLIAWQARSDKRKARELITAATQALSENAYRKAEALLAKLPMYNDSELQQHFHAANERVWLANYMATAPYASASAVAAAARLLKLQPNDPGAKKIAAQLGERWKVTSQLTSGVPANWAKPPSECMVARAVELCPLPPHLVAACKVHKRSPQEMVIAYGLALQSAGMAQVALNLMPMAKASWRDKLKLGGGRREKPLAWGIDLGGHALQAICLEPAAEPGEQPKIREIVKLPYNTATATTPPNRDGQLSEPVRQVVAELAATHDLSQANVTVSLSGPQTLGRFFELPVPSPAKFHQAVEYEARSRVPLPAENVVFDYHAGDLPDSGNMPTRWVTLVAANRQQVTKRMDVFVELACPQLQLACSALAVVNAAVSSGGVAADRASLPGGLAVVDVGGRSTNITAITPHKLWFRSLYLGGGAMTQAVAQQLKIDRTEARKFCRRPDAAPWMYQVEEALLPVYDELAEQVRRSLEQCRIDTGQAIERVLLTGSESHSLGLLRYFRLGS